MHFRILAYLGNHQKDRCRVSQTDLSERFGARWQAVNQAVGELADYVIETFAGSTYSALRQRAEIGISDLRTGRAP